MQVEPGTGYIRGSGNTPTGDVGVQAIKPVYDSGRTDNEVARRWSQMESRAARAASLDELVEGARRVRAAYWEQFQIGKRSIIDLLNAENETYQARLSAITERLELIQVRYRLLGSLAGLTGYLGIQPAIPVAEPEPSGSARAAPDPAQHLPELR